MSDFKFEDIKSELEVNSFDFKSLEKNCFVDLSEEIKKPETLLSIGEHLYKGNYYPTSVMTAGEISAITATSKSKKSFLKSAFIASYIGGKTDELFPNIKTHRNQYYTILDFDTEQGKFYTQRTFRRVQDMTGMPYDNYYGYTMRNVDTKNRLKLIDECLKNQESIYKEPVKLVSIDGISDLVENTNDLVMSQEVSDYLMRWTTDYNIHIINVIHKGAQTNKPLGHMGTFVLKKSETVINLDKDKDGTIKVTNPYSRGYSFDEFNFDVNSNGLPYLIE